jgi:hypothetical protein
MTNRRERVSLPGVLLGEGFEATCTVHATKVTLWGVDAFCRRSIVAVSQPLPEGEYQLSLNGEVTRLRHQNGAWLSPS